MKEIKTSKVRFRLYDHTSFAEFNLHRYNRLLPYRRQEPLWKYVIIHPDKIIECRI